MLGPRFQEKVSQGREHSETGSPLPPLGAETARAIRFSRGARATLILVNGHPIAPSGNAAAFVDVLNIPLECREGVHVMLYGASAIYGSDAVAGVVNIHTQDEYIGPETLAPPGAIPLQPEQPWGYI